MKTGARLVAVPYLDPERRVDMTAPWGSSIAEVVALSLPGYPAEFVESYVRVTINGELVAFRHWSQLRLTPKNDNLPVVVVNVMPANSGVLRSVLSITIGIAALAAGQFYLGPLIAGSLGLTGFGAQAVAGLTTTSLILGGQLLVNALIPVRRDSAAAGNSPTYSATGFRNVANPDGVFPCPYGEMRYSPPYAALPYTVTDGLVNYLIALFVVGVGELEIEDVRLGDTPIDRFKEVTLEYRYGTDTDLPQTIYPTQVLQDDVNIRLSNAYAGIHGPTLIYTATDCTKVMLTATFLRGLAWLHTTTSGGTTSTTVLAMTVQFEVKYRLNGAGAWTTLIWTVVGAYQNMMVAFPFEIVFPTRGAYELAITRLTLDYDEFSGLLGPDTYISESWLTAVRSFRPEYPLNVNFPLSLIAVKIVSTAQLTGVLDNLNCLQRRVCLDWNGSTWVKQGTKNPASLFRYALQGPQNHYPVPDSKIDLVALQDWHDFCVAEGLEYNRIHDFDQSLKECLADIAAAGRASYRYDGEKFSVVIDRRQTQTFAKLTPKNSSGFSTEIPYENFPDALRAAFYDKTNNYKKSERIVPWPGFVGAPTVIENIEFPGIVDPDGVWIETRKRQYEAIYRRETIYISQDWEGAIPVRGDKVEVNHYALDDVQASAYVTFVSGSAISVDNLFEMEAGKTYAIRFRRLGVSDSAPDAVHYRTVQTVAGIHDAVFLTGTGETPAVGELVSFGEATNVTYECVVRAREATQDFGFRHQLVPYAGNIFDLLDAEVPPPWDGRFGDIIGGEALLDFSDANNSQYLAMGWM